MRVHRQVVVLVIGDPVMRLPGGRGGIDVHGRVREILEVVEQSVTHLDGDGVSIFHR